MDRKILRAFSIPIILAMLALAITPGVGLASTQFPRLQEMQPESPEAPVATNPVFLPYVRDIGLSAPVVTSIMIGSEAWGTSDQNVINKITGAKIKYNRDAVFDWSKIEPKRTSPATYYWGNVNETGLKNQSAAGINVIATVRFAASWAQKYPPYACGPIAQSALDAFAEFMKAAVKRYSVAPFNVKYWEIGNEPDIQRSAVASDSIFGCWGEDNDAYFGGGYYAMMLEKVYPAIKSVDPQAQVLVGGLVLDCDPAHPPAGKTCLGAKFLEGILINNGKNNGDDYFDMVSFHGYPGYDGTLLGDVNHPNWAHRGGVVMGKVDFIRSLFAKYGVNKPIYHSEGSLLCHEGSPVCQPAPSSAFFDAQADYLVLLYVRNWAAGLSGTSWYQFNGPGWRYSGLLDNNQNPKPVYYALQFLSNELGGMTYTQQIYQYSALLTYEFKNSSKRVWVMWAPDDAPHTINLPSGTTKVLDKLGNVIKTSNNQITVKRPIYIELTP